jgi:hypothetical protein
MQSTHIRNVRYQDSHAKHGFVQKKKSLLQIKFIFIIYIGHTQGLPLLSSLNTAFTQILLIHSCQHQLDSTFQENFSPENKVSSKEKL